ncbi:MAG: M28 family peptidase, partial [Promethearchaeota archaeon]
MEFIQKICDEVGPRLGGSEEERRAGNIIHEELRNFCDEVEQEEFTCHPRGFLDFIWITAVFYIAGILAYLFFNPLLSNFFIIIAFSIYIAQQNLLYEVVDFLFPKKSSFHVIGKIKPQQVASKLVLLSSHHDSAYEFPLFSKLGRSSVYIIIIAVLIVVLNIFLNFAAIILFFIDDFSQNAEPSKLDLSFLQLTVIQLIDLLQIILFSIGTIFVTVIALFLRSNKVVLGANDNLTGVAVVLECGRQFAQNRLIKTEIWLISFAGEEHMRGSKRFVKKHHKELQERQAILLNLECLNAESFLLATAENMFLTKHSPLLVEKVVQAAKTVNVPIQAAPLRFAGSDAANFSRKGLHATTIFG